MTSTLIVELDGNAAAFAEALVGQGVQATAEAQRVLVTLTESDNELDNELDERASEACSNRGW